MDYLAQILFFFGAIGVFNSFIVAASLLLGKSYASLSNRLFGLFLLVLNLRVLKSLFYAFSPEEPIWFLQSGPAFFLLIGPLFFTYIVSITKAGSIWLKFWKYHFAFWMLIILALMLIIPFSTHRELNKAVILPITSVVWIAYVLLAGSWLFSIKRSVKIVPYVYNWLWALTLSMIILGGVFTFVSFDYFISGSMIFSVLFYAFLGVFQSDKAVKSRLFEKIKIRKKAQLNEEVRLVIHRLNNMMEEQKLYMNSKLKIADLSQKLEIPTHELSRLINLHEGKKFTDYVNEYRIKEAKRLIEGNSIYTIEAIGHEAGFNSKSAFYRAFKKFCGMTPANYKSQF